MVARTLQCQLFNTDLGPVFLAWKENRLVRLRYGAAAADVPYGCDEFEFELVRKVTRTMREARARITRFASGKSVSLNSIPLDMRGRTVFQTQVLQECRKVSWGSVVSYGDLAGRIGKPRAARAVGSVMRSNRHPLVIPCHRVIAANGRLGGYSADDGVGTKAKLLSREGVSQYVDQLGLR